MAAASNRRTSRTIRRQIQRKARRAIRRCPIFRRMMLWLWKEARPGSEAAGRIARKDPKEIQKSSFALPPPPARKDLQRERNLQIQRLRVAISLHSSH